MNNHTTTIEHVSAEPLAFAALQWPAALAAMALPDEGWGLALRIVAGLWVLMIGIAAFQRGRGFAFGFLMAAVAIAVVATWWLYPSPAAMAMLPLILFGLHAAQRSRLQRVAGANLDADSGSTAERA